MGYLHTPEEVGEITERLLIRATRWFRPSWLTNIERASTLLDIAQIDVVADVIYPNKKPGQIAIQVKSSLEERNKYLAANRWAVEANILCLVIAPTDHRVTAGLHAYTELWKHVQLGVDHSEVIEIRSRSTLNTYWRAKQLEIELRRKEKIKNLYTIKPPGVVRRLHFWWVRSK